MDDPQAVVDQAIAEQARPPVTFEQADETVQLMCWSWDDRRFTAEWFTDRQWRSLVEYCRKLVDAGLPIAYVVGLHYSMFLVTAGGPCSPQGGPDES
jgi:hypothetical protein